MSGTIILIDGPSGCGKTTFACGVPEPRALLETDPDGSRWLREHFTEYSNDRSMEAVKKKLAEWADAPVSKVVSIVVDTWSYFWLLVVQHVMDENERKQHYDTKNTYKAWGPAKMSIRRLHDQLVRAKRAGKQVLLVSHTKEKTSQADDKTVVREGLVHTGEAFLNDILDVGLRMFIDYKKDTRYIEAWKCRPQRNFKPLIVGRIDVPRYESQTIYPKVLEMIGHAPESNAASDSEAEDASAVNAMKQAATGGR